MVGTKCSDVTGGLPSKKISGGHVRSLLKYRLGDNFLLQMIPETVKFQYPLEDLLGALPKTLTLRNESIADQASR